MLTEPDTAYGDIALEWSADRKRIYFIRRRQEGQREWNIWSLSVADGSVKQLTDLKGRNGFMNRDFATDGKYLYFTWDQEVGDIWVMDVEREE